MTQLTQFCDSRDGFKLKYAIENRNIGIVDYEYINEKKCLIKFKSFDSLSKKKYCLYLKLMFLTPGKLLAFKLAFSGPSL